MSKNTHLEHLEDSILFDGKQGAVDAFKFLDLLANTFSGKLIYPITWLELICR